jgi:hypothetical protein
MPADIKKSHPSVMYKMFDAKFVAENGKHIIV